MDDQLVLEPRTAAGLAAAGRPLRYLPYHEPTLVPVLVLTAFLYLVNAARVVADQL